LAFARAKTAGFYSMQMVNNGKVSLRWSWSSVIKFLHLKGLKLQEIATELSSAYGEDARAAEHKILTSSGEPISKRNMLAEYHLSTMLMLKLCHFSEKFRVIQCERLLTP
jgi:hypothetical protein